MDALSKSYDHAAREQFWREFWEREKIYAFDEESDRPIFSVDTPPPYVSAEHLHSGHIMSYSQAEFVVRYKRMRGFNVFYPMGFDDNGLPTERFVEKKYNINKNTVTRSEFIKKCLEETRLGAENYKKLWSLLGISVDWNKTYSTINRHSQKISQWSFIDLYRKGLIERKLQPMHWCITCQTALAQADLEDKDEEGVLHFINFGGHKSELLVATTRPELIPACVAIFYNPSDLRYRNLYGHNARVPLLNYEVPILADESVAQDFGTGLMMVCTWGDAEDIDKWQRHKLNTRNIFDEKGTVNDLGGQYKGTHFSKLRARIVEDLQKASLIAQQEMRLHTLNVHERCGTPAEFVLTKQWFINLLNHREDLIKQGGKINWFPERMQQIYRSWVESLKWDWCISRQRYYGVPFPVWYCKNCEIVLLPEESRLPVDPTEDTPPANKCPECGGKEIVPEKDVMDTWMTSSLSPVIASRLVQNPEVQSRLYPATLRPQAFEIIRTWLFYTVVKSFYHDRALPFRDAMISGHGLDEQGRKISKRLGNYVDPVKIIGQYGADAVRYWTTGASLGENLRYSEEEIKKGKKTVTKLFNAAKFAQMHLANFTPAQSPYRPEASDRWILRELGETVKKAEKFFDGYEYSKARNIMEDFFWHAFTDNYLEFIKYRLYEEQGVNQQSKYAAQQTLFTCLRTIIKLYAPLLPYITEEIYQALFRQHEREKSIHLSSWPVMDASTAADDKAFAEFQNVLELVNAARKYKSDRNLSVGKELENFEYQGSDSLKSHLDFLQKALRIKNITITS